MTPPRDRDAAAEGSLPVPPDDHLDDLAPDDCDLDDEEAEAEMNCGSHRRGQCDLAGTEWCDWSCPFSPRVFRR